MVVYVPQKSADHYKALADRYASKTNEQKPTPVDETIAHIDSVRHALFKELYTDASDKLPPGNDIIWWEVWVDLDYKDRAAEIFKKVGIESQSRVILFAESCIFHVKALQAQLLKIIKSHRCYFGD